MSEIERGEVAGLGYSVTEYVKPKRVRKSRAKPPQPDRWQYPHDGDQAAIEIWRATPAPTVRRRTAGILIDAFGTRCALCHREVDIELVMPHPASFAIDHREPKSLGGYDELGNLDLAHNQCNGQKNDLSLPEPSIELYGALLDEAVGAYKSRDGYVLSAIATARREAHFAAGGFVILSREYEDALSTQLLEPWSSDATKWVAMTKEPYEKARKLLDEKVEIVRVLQEAWTNAGVVADE